MKKRGPSRNLFPGEHPCACDASPRPHVHRANLLLLVGEQPWCDCGANPRRHVHAEARAPYLEAQEQIVRERLDAARGVTPSGMRYVSIGLDGVAAATNARVAAQATRQRARSVAAGRAGGRRGGRERLADIEPLVGLSGAARRRAAELIGTERGVKAESVLRAARRRKK